MVHQSLLGSK